MEVSTALRKEEGSCSNCHDRENPTVFLVTLGYAIFRLCPRCKDRMIEEFSKLK